MQAKRMINTLILTFLITVANISSVFANTSSTFYEATVPKNKTVYLDYERASYNYVYALNKITSATGRASIHSYYQTEYNSKAITVGEELIIEGAGDTGTSLWRPTGTSSNPSGYTITNRKNCEGNNVTSNYCAIQGSKYRLKLDNQNLLYYYEIKGQFIFTD